MTKRIFKAIVAVAVIVLLATMVPIMGVLYEYFSDMQKQQLQLYTELAARGLQAQGVDYFKGLDMEGYRVTWIDQQGHVLFDSEADHQDMENHLDREEVKEALSKGSSSSVRYSETLTKRLWYYAERLPDGTILRTSSSLYSVWVLMLGVLQPILVVAVLAVLFCLLLASRLSARLVKPLNEVDLQEPLKNLEYEELRPMLSRIDLQRRQLEQDRDELAKNEKIRREFTANVSHELKTPLHCISGYAELLANGMVQPQDVQPFAEKIFSESRRMSTLVENIIDLSHLDSGAPDMQREELDLYDIASNAVDSLDMAAQEADVELELQGGSAKLKGVPQLLHAICYNLCDNGIKYNRKGGKVTVKVEDSEKEAILSVKDTGIGIPKQDQERIYERFYQVDKSRSKAVGGTGLGLSIVKHAAMIHQASLSLESVPGTGTTFTVRIPKN